MVKCPKCGARLPVTLEMGSDFKCPGCGAHLKSNYLAAGSIALIIGGLPMALVSPSGGVGYLVAGIVGSILLTVFLWQCLFTVSISSDGKAET